MLRLLTLTFLGKPRDQHAFEHAHESPFTMTVPLAILAVGSILAVVLGWPEAFGGTFAIQGILEPSITYGQVHAHAAHHGSHWLAWLLASISTAIGLTAAWYGWKTYKNGTTVAEGRATSFRTLHSILLNKYYVDECIERFLLAPARLVGNLLFKLFDVIVIDGLGVNLPAALARLAGDIVSLLQTGRVRNYILTMGLGVIALIWIFLK
jgi:NADH-quinone oxidoreductase subunit L